MLRSMFSAVSGLRAHQTMMDVVGNNVANVNTTGYKSSRATFRETITQALRGAGAPVTDATTGDPTQGGTNPMQLGLGVAVAATDGVFTQGATQVTGRGTDLAIQGDGFFVVKDGAGRQLYTRAGAFSFDASGNLVGPGGELVLGSMTTDATTGKVVPPSGTVDPANPAATPPSLDVIQVDPATYSNVTIGPDGVVRGKNATSNVVEDIGMIGLARFTNPNGLERIGNSLFADTTNSGTIGFDGPGGDVGTLQTGTLEMSNVDLAQEFTNLIIAQRGFQANARTITASDEMLQDLVNLKR